MARDRVLPSSAERRFQELRHSLTLQVFVRQGDFWTRVNSLRSRWHIEPAIAVPPALNLGHTHQPTQLRERRVRWQMSTDEQQQLIRWRESLRQLYLRTVGREYRIPTSDADSFEFWSGFLSACVLYDPPQAQLIQFADHPVARYEEYLELLDPWREYPGPDQPMMLAAPIQFVRDVEQETAAERARWMMLIDFAHELLKLKGVDLWEIVFHFDYEKPREEGVSLPRPMIDVQPETTERDALHAYRLITARQGNRSRRTKARRDPLVALQVAVLYRYEGWSQEQIARHFGWDVQYLDWAKPRSETVRKYVVEGEQILRDANFSTHRFSANTFSPEDSVASQQD